MTAIAACRSCGTELLENARFCHGCGSPVDDGGTRAEYKQVTVLFADVVHSMDIAAAVGAERLREIMAELANRCAAVVQRYGGTVDKFTGDGLMAVFGAPVALEDHAIRACRAALGVQDEAKRLAVDIGERDGIDLQLRVGLNSGQVVAGDIGPGPFGYTTVGEQVGMAQRMESVAPPGGVMLSASTARLVHDAARLGEAQSVRIKGAAEPVPAHQLLGMTERRWAVARDRSRLVGRHREMAAVEDLLERALCGHGAVVTVAGSAGIGKSRLVHELGSMASRRGAEVFTTFCESHTDQVPFHAVARLVRATTGIEGVDGQTARERVRARLPDADAEDLLLLHDLLGIADPAVPPPAIDPDARRRRLTALLNAASLARETPAVYVVEDAHWTDEVSESLLADFLAVIPQTPSLVIITYRPEYDGALAQVPGAQTISLAPLGESETTALVGQLLGSDPSVGGLGRSIADRAGGNPFFVEEIVRDLAERSVLTGSQGAYLTTTDAAEVTVPATLQTTIAARIDRLDPKAKRALGAAAVVGSRFDVDLLSELGVEPFVDELVAAELIEQVSDTGEPEYVFHHPLVRAVAYEAQLKSDRAQLHRRLATAIEQRDPSVDENAALIGEHLEAAGDLPAAFTWHMRAGGWSANRDVVAARTSWRRARHAADQLPEDNPAKLAMRIAPRTLLCATAWRVGGSVADTGFDELRELTSACGDKRSLAMGMVGYVMALTIHSYHRESSRMATECMELFESIGDPTLIIGLAFPLVLAKYEAGEVAEALQIADRAIDLADGDPTAGNLIFGSPLAILTAIRGILRGILGQQGAKEDADRSVVLARQNDPVSLVFVIMYKYMSITAGGLLPDDQALHDTAEVLQIAERSGDDFALAAARFIRGITLYYRDGPERNDGFDFLMKTRDAAMRERFSMTTLAFIDSQIAREKARNGDLDGAIELARSVVQHLSETGEMFSRGAVTTVFVELLLTRATPADLREAEETLGALTAPTGPGSLITELPALRLRALLARAHGDEASYRDFVDRYHAMARSIEAEGHMAMAEAMA